MLQDRAQPKFIETFFKALKSLESKVSKSADLSELRLFVIESAGLMIESGHVTEAQEALKRFHAVAASDKAETMSVPQASLDL